jgi:hypothetical protein
MRSRPNKKMRLKGTRGSVAAISAVELVERNPVLCFHHTLCTPGAYACGASVVQQLDGAHENHDKSRLQSVYRSGDRGPENHDKPWRYEFRDPNTPRVTDLCSASQPWPSSARAS